MSRKEYMKDYLKKYRENHKEKMKQYLKLYNEVHKSELKEKRTEYQKINKLKIKEQRKQFHINNSIRLLKKANKYYQEHKEERLEYAKQYRKIHKREIRERDLKYQCKRRKNDINFKLSRNIRKRVWAVLRGYCKSEKTFKLIGCSVGKLKKYLENKFTSGMTWDNYGTGWNGKGMQEWHVDHIRPCISFDLSKPEEQRKCFHYTNLQPLWAEDNRKKWSTNV